MKKRFTEELIVRAIKQHSAGAKVEDICRDIGISNGTFYNWWSKYAGLEVNEAKCLNQHWFRALDKAKYEIDQWLELYNNVRPHSSLNYLPPAVYAKQVA